MLTRDVTSSDWAAITAASVITVIEAITPAAATDFTSSKADPELRSNPLRAGF